MIPPAAEAVSVHFPGVTTVTTLPLTVHTLGVLDVYVTGKPADDVPDNLKLVVPTGCIPIPGKVITCAAFIDTSRTTSVAASYRIPFNVPAPADALIVHVPGTILVTVVPLTLHTLGVLDVYVTGKPDEAVAATAKLVVATGRGAIAGNVTVCALLILMVLVTLVAAVYVVPLFVPPAWAAVIRHAPGVTTVTVVPLTVQMLGDADVNVTANPDEAVAATTKLVVPAA